ncbi:MAG: DUF1501 domain-containing protein [Planctomycetes bacterium]|nr:DUF1501 domain-containing protein [Planctomycetota bacterium]
MDRRSLLSLSCLGLAPFPALSSLAFGGEAPRSARAKSVLLLYMDGGPSHIDMFDLKPHAPDQIRGPVTPIETSVPGTFVGESLPNVAKQMHHLAQIRSVTHEDMPHDQAVYRVLTGYRHNIQAGGLTVQPTDMPHLASALTRADTPALAMPRSIEIPEPMRIDARILPGQSAGVLGARWNPFPVHVTRAGEVMPPDVGRAEQVAETRLVQRRELLGSLRNRSRQEPARATAEFSALQDQVMRILQRPSIHEAFDLDRESPALRDAYGRHRHGQSTLLARRLIEAGARFVTVYWGKEMQDWGGDWKPLLANNPWDTHRNHFPLIKDSLIPRADQTLAALLADLSDRGMLEDTLVVWMGEFGRSPKISSIFSTPGREHWPHAFSMLMAGAGIRGGHIHGATDRNAAYVTDDPVSPADITATILDALGVDPGQTVRSRDGEHRLSTGRPLTELFA